MVVIHNFDALSTMPLPALQINNDSDSPQQMRMLRLLQWQLQHYLTVKCNADQPTKTNEDSAFGVDIRLPIQLSECGQLKPAISIRHRREDSKTNRTQTAANSTVVWIIDIIKDSADKALAELYAQADVADCWLLNLNQMELHLYQKPHKRGYGSHRVLQVGDCATPSSVPLTVILQEPVPLHFMTRTLNGQQTYQSNALPFCFSRDRA